jgi:putative nucleotidyltransferase with HDIG domain
MLRRISQFRNAGAKPSESDIGFARVHLSEALFELFRTQHPRDVVHSVETARWLLARGHHQPDLIAAALLHDIGKGEQRRVDRVAFVLAGRLRLAGRAGDRGSRFEMRRAVARSAEHSRRGAQLLREAGASDLVVSLTLKHHAEAADDAMLALLQQADAAN